MSQATEPAAVQITAELIRAEHPAIAEAFLAQGRAAGLVEGATAERERILGIEQQALPGHDKLIASLKADGKTTPAEAAVQVLQAERGRAGARLDARREAEAALPQLGSVAAAQPGAGPAIDPSLPADQRCKAQWDRDPALRAEFGTLGAFVAWTEASEGGHASVMTRN